MSNHTAPTEPALASACRAIHPEDLLAGDYVTVLQQTYQVATYAWCGIDTHQFPPNEPIEISLRGYFEALKVEDICFPFLLCTNNEGEVRVIDSHPSSKAIKMPPRHNSANWTKRRNRKNEKNAKQSSNVNSRLV